ncbi:MAG: OmpA family protein [Pseudomonadota bacterium]
MLTSTTAHSASHARSASRARLADASRTVGQTKANAAVARRTQTRTTLAGALRAAMLTVAALCAAAVGAAAQSQTTDPDANTARINAIINDLAPPAVGRNEDPRNRPTVRRLVIADPQSPGRELVVWVDFDRRVSLQIQYAYNSARLQRAARPQLNLLARALQSKRLRGAPYLVAGHTDAVGSDAFNQDLSDRRAASARRYLTGQRGVAGDRLFTVGFGESQLADPARPNAAINRRVVLALIVAVQRGGEVFIFNRAGRQAPASDLINPSDEEEGLGNLFGDTSSSSSSAPRGDTSASGTFTLPKGTAPALPAPR